jgi:hypothetical protein
MESVSGEFEVANMKQETYEDLGGDGKLARASGTQAFSGGLTGSGTVDWLMCYRADGTARLVGLQRVEGTLDGRTGSFVVEAKADFDGAESRGTWLVVPGSATGALAGLLGEGEFQAAPGRKASFKLAYRFE